MEQLLYQYRPVDLATWIYLSSLLTIAIYFKFNRIWSLRNLDLLGLIAFAPGLLLIREGSQHEHYGYLWLFVVGALFMVRLLCDPMMTRRPLLEPNLSTGGLVFIGTALLLFLMTNVMMKPVDVRDLEGSRRLRDLLNRQESAENVRSLAQHGPGYPLFHLLPSISMRPLVVDTQAEAEDPKTTQERIDEATARTMAILSHIAIVLAIILVGVRHFDNIRTGIAAATLYLMLPYTAQMTGRVDHVLPAALLVWALAAYRRPLISGMLLGLSMGVIYYPVYLLPLWCSFYWHRGLLRFGIGVVSMLAVLVSSLALTSSSMDTFLMQTQAMFGFTSLSLDGVEGFWAASAALAPYRIPVVVACILLSISFALWPAQKNLGTLLSCSAAVMLGTQFWHAHGGGLYMAWYLPLLLLTVFRPNLEDRVAIATLGAGWLTRRRARAA